MNARHTRTALPLALILAVLLACSFPSAAPSPTPPEAVVPATGLSPTLPPAATPVPPTLEPTLPPTPTIVHLIRPSEPGSLQSFMTDYSSLLLAPEHRTLTDNYDWSFLERPFTREAMDYQPHLDLTRGELSLVPPWIYITLFLEDIPPSDALATYAVEIDLDIDGRGDWLITIALPQSGEWSTDRVRAYRDDDNDVGGVRPLRSDAPPQTGDGYETLVFDQGIGPDPDAVWARIPPGAPDRIQIAFKHDLIAADTYLLWGAWADGATGQAGWFDYNDHFTLAEAGSPLSTSPDYPLDQLASIDNTCRWAYDFVPTEELPGMCALPATPTPVPLGSISGFVFNDTDHDGVRDGGEGGLNGIQVRLGSGACASSGLSTATTPSSGAYTFPGLVAGTYCVTIVISPIDNCGGWWPPNTTRTITLDPGENEGGVNFGFYMTGPC